VPLSGPALTPLEGLLSPVTVTVWAALSLLVQVTVVPFLTVMLAGLKAKFSMVTLLVALGVLAAGLVDVDDCILSFMLFDWSLAVGEVVLAVLLFEFFASSSAPPPSTTMAATIMAIVAFRLV
jgi:hypothetical protein